MTAEIVKIQEREGFPCVDARQLHTALNSKQDFSTWIKNRIDKYGFEEKADYEVFHKFVENSQGGRPAVEYSLSIDMAKELAMVENNENGRKVRRYFIEVERRYFEGSRTRKELRLESKQVRVAFTNTLKSRGYDKAHHFIQTTRQMKKALGITAKKDDMTYLELAKTKASESLAEVAIIQKDAHGYHECNPICIESCQQVNSFTQRQLLK